MPGRVADRAVLLLDPVLPEEFFEHRILQAYARQFRTAMCKPMKRLYRDEELAGPFRNGAAGSLAAGHRLYVFEVREPKSLVLEIPMNGIKECRRFFCDGHCKLLRFCGCQITPSRRSCA